MSEVDARISRTELDEAAREIEQSENEDLEAIFRDQGAGDVVDTLAKEDQ